MENQERIETVKKIIKKIGTLLCESVWYIPLLVIGSLFVLGFYAMYINGECPDGCCEDDYGNCYKTIEEASASNNAGDEYYTDHQLRDTMAYTDMREGNHKSCNIKGNISYNTQEKIYHMPGCPNYKETEINETYGERWFCVEKEAINAGWRKAYNCD